MLDLRLADMTPARGGLERGDPEPSPSYGRFPKRKGKGKRR
jgi:hypothetical protein